MFGTNVFSSSSGDDEPIDIYILGMGVPVKQPVLKSLWIPGKFYVKYHWQFHWTMAVSTFFFDALWRLDATDW